MFTGSLLEEVKALEEDIEAVKAKVEDPLMCEKVRLFVYAPQEIQAVYKADASKSNSCFLSMVTIDFMGPGLHQLPKANTFSLLYSVLAKSQDFLVANYSVCTGRVGPIRHMLTPTLTRMTMRVLKTRTRGYTRT